MQNTQIQSLAKNKYLGTWSFYKRAISIALPVMAQQLIQNLVSLIDNFMVAGLGDIKMSGVNVAGQIFFIFFVMMMTICSSGGIFMSQFRGSGDKEGMQQVFRFKLIVTGLLGIAFALLCFAAPRKLFWLMVTKNVDADAILDQSQIYSRAVALSFIFAVFSQSIATSLREIEMVRAPLFISVFATLVNTFFNWLLIYGHLGLPRLEVAGAGYATVIARASELLIFLIYISIKKPDFLFPIKKFFSIRLNLAFTILKKSVVILYSELFWVISETVSNALYNTRGGADVVSGMAAGFAIANLIFISMGGITTSTGVIMGMELGAGNMEKCRSYKNWIITGALIFGFVFMLFGFLTTFLIPLVFGNLSLTSRKYAFGLIMVASLYLPLWGLINAQFAITRSGGDTKTGAICDTVGNLLFLGIMIVLTFLTQMGPVALYTFSKLSDFPKTILAHFLLKKERWLVNLTKENSQTTSQSGS